MVRDALQMTRWSRGSALSGLIGHSDAGPNAPITVVDASPASGG